MAGKIYYPGLDPETDPAKKREFRQDQLEAIYRIKHEITDPDRSKNVLVGAGMGSGKTGVSVEVIIKTAPERCLIVGVKDAYGQWADTLRDQQEPGAFGHKRKLMRIDSTPTGKEHMKWLLDGDPGLFYVGLEFLRTQDWKQVSETMTPSASLKGILGEDFEFEEERKAVQLHVYKNMKPVDLLISDESHKHSNQKSASIQTVREINAKAKIALSGTFFANRFENAWVLATWLWGKKVIGTKTRFEFDYTVKIPLLNKRGKPIKTPSGFALSKVIGERNPGEYVETLPCYVFIATPIGPVPEPEIVKVELKPIQAKQYEQMRKQSLAWLPVIATGHREPLIADLPITQRIRLRTAALGAMTLVPGKDPEDPDSIMFAPGCESSTLDAVYEVMHRPDWVDRKVLLLTHSKQFAKEAARRISAKYPVFLKTGDTSSKKWEIEKASFMLPVSETGVQIMVAVISAVGTAMDGLQENCSLLIWMSEDESNVNNIQASNRVWRDGVDIAAYRAVKIVQKDTIAEGVLKKNDKHRTRTLTSIESSR